MACDLEENWLADVVPEVLVSAVHVQGEGEGEGEGKYKKYIPKLRSYTFSLVS